MFLVSKSLCTKFLSYRSNKRPEMGVHCILQKSDLPLQIERVDVSTFARLQDTSTWW